MSNTTNLLTPCLWCNSNALEKATYYTTIFPNSSITSQSPVMVSFTLNGTRFQALNGGVDFPYNESISWVIDCKDQDEVDYYWNNLTANGGSEVQCGWLKDKFGMQWQVVPKRLMELMMDPDAEKSSRVMQAMLQMKKIIVADLEKAYNNA